MEDALYQKIYFQEIYSTYLTMTYNQIVLNIVDKFNTKKIKYSLNSFNVFKSNLNKKKFNNKNIDEKLKEIKLYGKPIYAWKLEYIDKNKKENKKGFYLFGTDYSLSLLNSPEINQYFSDCTYKFIPVELKGKYSLLVILGYNYKRDKYQLILIALLTNEDTEIYSNLYNFLLNTYNFKPKYITFDFARGNINAESSKFDFNLWSYTNKFKFKGNKKKLIEEGILKEYVNFTNNSVESFNHLLNECINHNNKVSFTKFEDILKYVFIRMEGEKENKNIEGYKEKTLISDILNELIELDYGKNKKIIKKCDLKKIKSITDLDMLYKLTFENNSDNNSNDN